MKAVCFLLKPNGTESPSESFFAEAAGAGVSVRISAPAYTAENDTEALYVTDVPEVAALLAEDDLPVLSYEHDGVRMPGSHVILSLSDLTLHDCEDVYADLTGSRPVISDGKWSLLPTGEDDFVRAFDMYREEPYMLTEAQLKYTESDVRALFATRASLAQCSGGYATLRAMHDGKLIGFVSALPDPDAITIDFYVLSEQRGHGYAKNMCRMLLKALATQRRNFDFHNSYSGVYALVHPDNAASVKTLEALGFHKASNNDLTSSQPDAPQEMPLTVQDRSAGQPQKSRASRPLPRLVYYLPDHR